MNSPMEDRLRDALVAAGATVEHETLTPLRAPAGGLRSRVDLRLVAVAAALAGVAMFLVLRPMHQAPLPTLAAGMMPAKWSQGEPEIAVFLCRENSPLVRCLQSPPPDRGAIEQALLARPEVESVVFEDQETAYRKFQQSSSSGEIRSIIKVSDMPESFRVKLRPGVGGGAVVVAASDLDGVATVVNHACFRDEADLIERFTSRVYDQDGGVCKAP